MKTRLRFLFIFLIALASVVVAQVRPDSSQLSAVNACAAAFGGGFKVRWQDRNGTADIITFGNPRSFAEDPAVSAQVFLQRIGGVLKKRDAVDQLRAEETRTAGSARHIRFEQYYRNVPVRGGEYVVTVLPGGKIQTALGAFLKDIQVDVTPHLNAQQALLFARQNPPPKTVLKDSLISSLLIIYPKDTTYYLAWELCVSPEADEGKWVYLIDASNGTVLDRMSTLVNEMPSTMQEDQPRANVYLTHPFLDASYPTVNLVSINTSGFLQGTYADVLNDVTFRAYSPMRIFTYQPGNIAFDEANLFYHITRFRLQLWNALGFSAFTQITAHAHHAYYDDYGNPAPNAKYDWVDHHIRFSNGQGVAGYNSFAKEDKVIFHEYTHAVTDYIAHLYDTNDETGAIWEGNSDYYAASFTDREKICEYAAYGHSNLIRDLSAPRIATYSEYQNYQWYPHVEQHVGGELWSRCLWDLYKNPLITKYYADRVIYYGLSAIPRNSLFVQYCQAIIDKDNSEFGGAHAAAIQNSFALRGTIWPTTPTMSGPTELSVGQQGTWTVSTNWPSGNYSYAWYYRSNETGGQWYGPVSTTTSYTTHMYSFDGYLDLRVDVTAQITRVDGSNGTLTASPGCYVTCTNCPPCPGCPQKIAQPLDSASLMPARTVLPMDFLLTQNYPNPFNPATEISFALPEPAHVKIVVLDLLGREITTLMNQSLSSSLQTLTWRGEDASGISVGSGLYFCRLTAQGVSGKQFVKTIKMVLLR